LNEVAQVEAPPVDGGDQGKVPGGGDASGAVVRSPLIVASIKGESAKDRAAREKLVKTFLDDAKRRMKEGYTPPP
jgi:hypothetical protein